MARHHHRCTVGLALGLLTLPGLAVTRASAGKHPVPFRQVTKRDSLVFTGVQSSLLTFQEIQTGEGTHFGKVTWTANGTVDPNTGVFSGTLTEVTANGDLVSGTFAGGFTGAESGLTGEGSIAFTGGTGQFQDLTGSATFQTFTDANTGVATLKAEGTITY